MSDYLSKSKLLNTVDSSFHVDMFKRSIGVPQVCFWSCAVQNVIFQNIKKYYGPIWCTMIHQNTKLANVVHTLHFSVILGALLILKTGELSSYPK